MANYDAEVRVSTKVDTSQMQRLQLQIDKAVQKVDTLTKKYDELKNKRIPTEAYTELESKLASAKAELTALIAKEEKFKSIGATTGVAWDTLIQKEADAQLKIESLNAEMQKLVDAGKDFTIGADPGEINNAANELSRAKSELRMLVTKQGELQTKSYKVSDSLKKVGQAGKKAFSSLNGHIRKSSGMLGSFASRLKSIALSLLVFNWITKGFNAMVSGMKDGFKNLVQYSDEYNRSISSLQSANLQLKNSFAAAFAPIVQMVIPYLVQLIGYVTSAVNAFAQFIAILGGKTTWTRAAKVQQNYAASLNGTAAAAKKATGALASFDEIDVLNKKDNSGSGGGINPGSMFEKVPVGKLSDFWKKLLDALKKGKWYELGKFLGEQLKKALDNIPWDEIKEKARNIGKNLADLINGFIEVEGLGYSIGRTLAEAFNTGFEFLNSFVHEFHFDSLGRFLAETFNGLFENIDWSLIKDTFVTGTKGLADLINNFDQYFHWDNISDTISNGLNTLAATIITFFETADWLDIGKNVGEQLIKSIEKTDWESVGRAIGDVLHSAIVFLAGVLSEWDWGVIVDALKDLFKGFNDAFDNIDLPDNIRWIANAIEILGGVLVDLIAIKGITDVATSLSKFFSVFTGNTLAGEITSTATAIDTLAGSLAAIAAGDTAIKIWKAEMEELADVLDLNKDQVDTLLDRYSSGLFSGTFNIAKDAVGGFSAALDGLPFALEGVTGKMDALDKMMRSIGDGTVYTDEQLKKAQDTWQLSADDVEMLRQAMFDANDATFAWSNAFPELDNASAQTLVNITEGMALMRDGMITNEVELANLAEQSGYTNEAFSFLADYLTESVTPAFSDTSESVMGNTTALQAEQTELTNTNTSLSTHQQALENTNTKLKSTQTEMTNTKNKSKEMADGINTNSNDVKKTTDSVWPQVGNKMKTEMLLAHDSICEMLAGITTEVNNVLAAIGALTKAGASAGASIGSSVLASVHSVQTQNYVQDIPHLATGSIIRGGNPFMAVLGDQKFGQTNIEAPLSTIEDAVRNVMADNSYSGGDMTINLNYDGETFARLFLPDFFAEAHRQGYDFDFEPE